MKVRAPFGFVTGCHAADKFMVQATLASMRHFCPSVPICLTVDGDFDVSDLEREYGVIVLRVSDLPSAEMRALLGGNHSAKMAAMWEGPFDYFVWLDSDAIVWGDFTRQIRTDADFHIFWSDISIPDYARRCPGWLAHFYFDSKKLARFDAGFEWRGLAYFCSGAFACRRNAIAFDFWKRVVSWQRADPGLFAWGEMGMLNYAVHSLAQGNQLRTAMTDLQHVWAYHGVEELVRDCEGVGWRFPDKINRPRVAHFCYRKPFLFDRHSYSRPFTIARLEHYRRHHSNPGAWLAILAEDFQTARRKARNRLEKLIAI